MSKQAQIHKAKEDLKASVKTLSLDEEVSLEFAESCSNNFFAWNGKLITGEKKITIPEVNGEDLVRQSRAASDMALCYFLFHSNACFNEFESSEEKKFFNDFERVRLVAKMRGHYLGSVRNILEKIEGDIFTDSGNLSLLLLNEIFAEKILPTTKAFAEEVAGKINSRISQQIKVLAENIDSQSDFLREVERLLELVKNDDSEDENEEESEEPVPQNKQQEIESFGAESAGENEQNLDSGGEETQAIEQENIPEEIAEVIQGDSDVNASTTRGKGDSSAAKIEFINAYKIFTSQFDEVVYPQKLISKHDLELLWDQLSLKLEKLSDISRKMSLKLKKKLLSKRSAMLEFDSSRGILNRKKLTRLVLDPTIEDIWVNQQDHQYQNTALTILLDNSGSMRGAPIVMSAMACKIIAEILEKFSVKLEIIGFTTVDWKGGKARKIWEAGGRPKNPGRLTDLRHVIYKSFNQSFKKSQVNLGLMLKEGILKENIDGEALLFARSRLMQQSEERKILMVISDGTPIDDSTLANNDAEILSNHLTHVVNKIEKSGKIEMVGIGIGHDTGNFYRNSMVIKDLEDLGDVMINKLCEIL